MVHLRIILGDNAMNQGRTLPRSENTAMTGAPGYTSWIQLQQYSHASNPHKCLASTYDDNNPIKLRRISSLRLVECADVTSLGCRLLLRLRARFCALLTLD
jgi:hypothetical protein